MGKKYLEKNVLDASLERIEYIFNEFEHIYVSLSGGKDSSVTIQLFNIVAKKLNRTFDVMFIDYEAQYTATINHCEELKELSNIGQFYHICWNFKANNASSVFQRFWYPWNERYKKIWVRDMPKTKGVINIHNYPDNWTKFFNSEDMFLRGLFNAFSEYYKDLHKTDKVANIQGLRTDESMNRFRSVAFGKNLYKNLGWSTDNFNGVYSFYPIYDWSTEDIWGAVSILDLKYNEVYELMQKNGIPISEQRIAQPYGLRQKNSLNQWAVLEPETWQKLVNRVSGTNFGALYAKTSLMGHNGTEKPEHINWQEYCIFLLESIGLYEPELMKHYYRKIKIYIDHYIEEGRINDLSGIEEEISKDAVIKKYGRENGRWIQWKRIAKCIEKNDFALTGCNYGITIQDKKDMKKLKEKWGALLGIQTHTKEMQRLKEELDNEERNQDDCIRCEDDTN